MPQPPTPYNPRRFRSTVPFYARYRLSYPGSLIGRVIEIAALKKGDAVMDLGCGPGLLAIAFAKAGMAVTAIDPEPDMLAAAMAAAAEAGVVLDVCAGSSFDLPAGIGPFRLVTMGRSFHWMDRATTLKTLDGLVVQGGALVFFDDDHPRTAENEWRRRLREIGNRYGRALSPHVEEAARADYRSRESLLLDSAFSRIESCAVVIRREITVEEIVGLAFSLSTSSPERLGEKKDEFEAELRASLAEISPDGRFTEIAELEAQVARRP